MQIKKENISDQDIIRKKILGGVTKMNDLVSITLGHAGRSVLIERGVGEPLMVDDGRRVAENIKLDDPIEQLAVRILYGVTRKTDEKAGDGTTTSMVLAHAILEEAHKNHISFGIGANTNVAELDRKLQDAKTKVVEKLRAMAKEVKTEEDLIKVATVSSGSEEIGKMVGSMYHQLGENGHITLEFNLLSEKLEYEVASGYRFSGGLAAEWMTTDSTRKEASFPDTHILVAHREINEFKDVLGLASAVAKEGKSHMVVIAKRFSQDFLRNVYVNATKQQSPFTILCVKAPGRHEEAYKDMAIYTGGKYFNENDDISQATFADLGYAKKVDVTDDTCILIEGKGKKTEVEKRIKEVEIEAESQKMPAFKNDRYERISSLSGGVGVIRIGAPTDDERNWLKYKIEDAKYATKWAFKEGIVPGGGQAYKEASKILEDGEILKTALLAPEAKLKDNCGGTLKVGKDIIDPVRVEIAALEYAVSAVSKLIRIGGAIAMKSPSLGDELISKLGGEES